MASLVCDELYQVANRWENGSGVKCARHWPTSSAHQATREVHTRLHEQCTPGYTSSAHQATRAVHTRLHEQCTPGYMSSAHQDTRAVHTRLHEQCTPVYTSSAHKATQSSFLPTVNQTRTRTVTSCYVMANSNSENINAFQL